MTAKHVGALIQKTREEQGVTLRQLSKKIGLPEKILEQVEEGSCHIVLNKAAAIAKALKIKPDTLHKEALKNAKK